MKTSWMRLSVISDNGAILFETDRLPRAYRRRVAISSDGTLKVCHIIVLADDDIVFVFEQSGEVIRKNAFEPNTQWFYAIKE